MGDLVGIGVVCSLCGRGKQPMGRSVPAAMAGGMCDYGCSGYKLPPFPGSLWPGERESEFGYPVGTDATREADDA